MLFKKDKNMDIDTGKEKTSGLGGMSMGQLLKQAQHAQKEMQRVQQEIEVLECEASAGDGLVTARVNGKKELLAIIIKAEAINPDNVEQLQELIKIAVNDAVTMADTEAAERMSAVTGGFGML